MRNPQLNSFFQASHFAFLSARDERFFPRKVGFDFITFLPVPLKAGMKVMKIISLHR
jgi:hypothetical protein